MKTVTAAVLIRIVGAYHADIIPTKSY